MKRVALALIAALVFTCAAQAQESVVIVRTPRLRIFVGQPVVVAPTPAVQPAPAVIAPVVVVPAPALVRVVVDPTKGLPYPWRALYMQQGSPPVYFQLVPARLVR